MSDQDDRPQRPTPEEEAIPFDPEDWSDDPELMMMAAVAELIEQEKQPDPGSSTPDPSPSRPPEIPPEFQNAFNNL